MGVNFVENINMSVRTLSANKMRSCLTMLGIIIGNSSVIAMINVGQGAQNFINKQFESLGTNVLFVLPGIQQGGPQIGTAQANTLVLADAEAIAREVPAVLAVAPEKTERLRIGWADRDTQVNVTGTTPIYTSVRNPSVARGRFFNELEVQSNHRVAVLGRETASRLFGNRDPLGEKIRIRNLSFQVIGVMAEKGSSMGTNQDEVVFVPIKVMATQLTGKGGSLTSPTVQSISVSARSPETISAAHYQITNLLRLRHGIKKGENDFTVRSQQDLLKTANLVTGMLVIFLAATSGISLVVGGIGIMNIMLVSVTERTHEIGLRKAIGATGTDVMVQFTTEAIILSVAGGSLGIAIAVAGTLVLATLTPLEAVISPAAIILAVGMSGAIGLGFGVIPARNAARLEPIVALRS